MPALREVERMSAVPAFVAECGDRYRLASFDVSGFTVYSLLRGFENAMQDLLAEPEGFAALMDRIMAFECELMEVAARHGFHGIHFADDWGMQSGLMISPALWRRLFKPRYARQFARAHELGLHTWYHCCGRSIRSRTIFTRSAWTCSTSRSPTWWTWRRWGGGCAGGSAS